MDSADFIWEQIETIRPELILLDSALDAFGTMNLYMEIKQKFEDLPVIVYKAEDLDAVDRIKTAIADVFARCGSGQDDRVNIEIKS